MGDGPDADWRRVKRAVKAEIPSDQYRTWIAKASLMAIDDEEVTLGMPNVFERDWVRQKFADHLFRAWRKLRPDIARVTVEVAEKPQKTAGS